MYESKRWYNRTFVHEWLVDIGFFRFMMAKKDTKISAIVPTWRSQSLTFSCGQRGRGRPVSWPACTGLGRGGWGWPDFWLWLISRPDGAGPESQALEARPRNISRECGYPHHSRSNPESVKQNCRVFSDRFYFVFPFPPWNCEVIITQTTFWLKQQICTLQLQIQDTVRKNLSWLEKSVKIISIFSYSKLF